MVSTTGLGLAVAAALLSLSARAQDSSPTGPTFPNMAANCNAFHTVVSGDSCWDITVSYGLTLSQFYDWNPDIEDECGTNFWLGYSYCVGVGSAPSASSSAPISTSALPASSSIPPSSSSVPSSSSSFSSAPPSSITSAASSTTSSRPYTALHPITEYNITTIPVETQFPPTRTLSGQPAACTNWHLPNAFDTCRRIVASYSSLTDEDLLEWNPTLGEDCGGLYAGWWVCVGINGTSTYDPDFIEEEDLTTSVVIPTATAFTPPALPTIPPYVPEPTHAGTVAGCLQYAKAEAEDTCEDFVDGEMLTEAEFFALNPGLGDVCNGLWANYYCTPSPFFVLFLSFFLSLTRPRLHRRSQRYPRLPLPHHNRQPNPKPRRPDQHVRPLVQAG